jgi:hypothetical protein
MMDRGISVFPQLRRLTEIGGENRLLLAEAAGALLLASVAIRILPFRKVVEFAASEPTQRQAETVATLREIKRLRWAVEACAKRLPWRIVCFQKGLALHKLLLRRGIPTLLHYGVAQDAERGLTAHVWVTHEGEAIIGGEEAVRYTCLATFPATAQR